MQKDLNKNFYLLGLGYSNAEDALELPRHRWYFVKEAFSPQMVQSALDKAECQANGLILDPFCGSGTVPLSSSISGFRGIGIEVNPFLAFVSRVKLIQVRPQILEQPIAQVMRCIQRGRVSALEDFSTFCERGNVEKWLFNREVLRAFEGGWSATNGMYAPVRDLLRLGLLGAAMDVCNAVRDGKCLRYLKNWQKLKLGRDDFLSAFEKRIEEIKEDLVSAPNNGNQSAVIQGDARNALRLLGRQHFDLCVTSPPYLNSFDYTDVYRPELFLGKFVRSQAELRGLRQLTVRSHVQAKWKDPVDADFGERYKDVMKRIEKRSDLLWDERIPLMIQAYFEDMKCVMRDLRQYAKLDAKLWIVVSTSAYSGIEVPVDLILADIGSRVGWNPLEVGLVRSIRAAGQHWNRQSESSRKTRNFHLRESVVIFKAAHRP